MKIINMKRRGRNIVVGNLQYQWRKCRAGAVIWDYNDNKYIAQLYDLTGLGWHEFERGQWKKTVDGMIMPIHIAAWIIEHLQDGKKRDNGEILDLGFNSFWREKEVHSTPINKGLTNPTL
jgi:hypothetical protein